MPEVRLEVVAGEAGEAGEAAGQGGGDDLLIDPVMKKYMAMVAGQRRASGDEKPAIMLSECVEIYNMNHILHHTKRTIQMCTISMLFYACNVACIE